MLVITVHVIICLLLIGIVLLQKGKGADMGATFGGAGSQTLFGNTGPSTLLGKVTTVVAVIFMVTSLFLGYIQGRSALQKSVILNNNEPISQPVAPPVMPTPALPETAQQFPDQQPLAPVTPAR